MLRIVNHYGDPVPWSLQKSIAFTFLSFLNCTKYPGSLDFVLMTLGPAILLLRLDRSTRRVYCQPAGGLRARTDVLFYSAFLLDSRAVGPDVVPLLWPLRFQVYLQSDTLNDRPRAIVSVQLRIQPLDGLHHLDQSRRGPLSAMPLVRRRKGAKARLVAELSLAVLVLTECRLKFRRGEIRRNDTYPPRSKYKPVDNIGEPAKAGICGKGSWGYSAGSSIGNCQSCQILLA